MVHRYYPTSHYINLRFKKDVCINCSLCDMYPETMLHLFWNCAHTDRFWKDVCRYIVDNIDSEFCLYWQNVLFGLSNNNKKSKEVYIINLIIILAKFHIHKSKFSHSKPSFLVFEIEAKQYIKTIYYSKNKKAVKTVALCSAFNIFC